MTKSNDVKSAQAAIDWTRLEDLAAHLSQSGMEPGTVPDSEWHIIEQALGVLINGQNWSGILQLRAAFNPLYAGDTVAGLAILQALDQHAIQAARHLGNKRQLGHLLGSKGHNLHRQGYHQDAINAFDESAKNYREIGEDFPALESYYMTSLCYRALGNRERARQILEEVIHNTDPDDPWRANPLQVMAWLIQDAGNLSEAEKLLQQALILYEQTKDPDLLVAGALADLGEIAGILGRFEEARQHFERSLLILSKHQGQYDRQEARALLKFSELLMHQEDYPVAIRLLNQADDKVSRYGHYYDLLWQIELAKAFIFVRDGQIFNCLAKMRSVLRIRRQLGLSNILLIQYVMKRYAQRL